jgi:hypothetical protein
MLSHALTLGDSDTWLGFADVIAARLTDGERAAMAFAALVTLDADQVDGVISAATGATGGPSPAFLNAAEELSWWAGFASSHEIDAGAVACVNAMPLPRRQAFLRYLTGVAV